MLFIPPPGFRYTPSPLRGTSPILGEELFQLSPQSRGTRPSFARSEGVEETETQFIPPPGFRYTPSPLRGVAVGLANVYRLRRLTLLAHMRGLRRSPTLGEELFYLGGRALLAVPIEQGDETEPCEVGGGKRDYHLLFFIPPPGFAVLLLPQEESLSLNQYVNLLGGNSLP